MLRGTKPSYDCPNPHMKLPRFIGVVDIGLIAIVLVAVALPPRSMDAAPAVKGNEDRKSVV